MSGTGVSLLLLLTAYSVCRVAPQRPQLVRELRPHYTLSPSSSFSECRFTGSQPLTVQWSYEGNRLPSESSGGPYFTSEGILVLRNARSGNYTCTGSNSRGSLSVSTTITVESEDSSPVARQWFMLFVYAVLVWLVGCALIAGMMCYRSRQTANQKPLPVDRNECVVIDHGRVTVEDEPQSGSRVSGDYSVFEGGYTNPSYGMSDRDETTAPGSYTNPSYDMPDTTATRFVDYSSDGTRVTTTTNTEKEFYYIPPSTSQPAQPTEPGRRASRRRDTGHSEASDGADAALQLAEKQKTT